MQNGAVQGKLLRGNYIPSREHAAPSQLTKIDPVAIQLQHVSDHFIHGGNILGSEDFQFK